MKAQQLRDEIALRQASLADAARERAQGELDDAGYQAIVDRETVALAKAQATLAALMPAAPKARRRRKNSRLVIGVTCLALAAVGLVWINLSLRQAGTSQTGGVQVGGAQKVSQLLIEGQGDLANNNALAALAAYDQVLAIEPHNEAALTEAGWLDFSAGSADHSPTVVARAVSELRQAVHYGPSDPAPHLYYGIVASLIPGNTAVAKHQFEFFLKLKPSKAQLAVATPYLARLGIPA